MSIKEKLYNYKLKINCKKEPEHCDPQYSGSFLQAKPPVLLICFLLLILCSKEYEEYISLSVIGELLQIRNGRKSSRRIINRPFRSARIAEKTFSQNGVPAHSAASAATLAVSSGGQITGKQIHPWRKSPCGANAAGRRCAQIRKSIAAVPAISEPWKKHTVSRYVRGAGKNFRSMQGKNASIAAGTVPVPRRLRQRIFAEASEGFSIQNRKAGQSISGRQREKQSWIVTASASGLYAERPACTQGSTA